MISAFQTFPSNSQLQSKHKRKTRALIGRFGIYAGKQSKQMILHFLQICLCAKKILLKN